jgi:hypothetical protein
MQAETDGVSCPKMYSVSVWAAVQDRLGEPPEFSWAENGREDEKNGRE